MPAISTDDGVQLVYDDEGTGSPVVLIAGFTAPRTSWLFQRDALLTAGYRVIALDRRAHGDSSSGPAGGDTMARHGQDLHNFLTALDLRDAFAVGGSQGASTIWSYVRQFGTDRLAGAIAVDQTPRMLNGDGWAYGFYGYTEENRDTYFAQGIPRTGHEPPRSPEVGMRMLQALARPGADPTRRPPLSPTDLELLHDHAIQDWRPEVAAMDVPMLLVAARLSDFWPYRHAEVTGGRSAIMDNVGHAANVEDPDGFNAIMLDFIEATTSTN
jgi:pimeloyl-ACP methyl ester carboxylesterase